MADEKIAEENDLEPVENANSIENRPESSNAVNHITVSENMISCDNLQGKITGVLDCSENLNVSIKFDGKDSEHENETTVLHRFGAGQIAFEVEGLDQIFPNRQSPGLTFRIAATSPTLEEIQQDGQVKSIHSTPDLYGNLGHRLTETAIKHAHDSLCESHEHDMDMDHINSQVIHTTDISKSTTKPNDRKEHEIIAQSLITEHQDNDINPTYIINKPETGLLNSEDAQFQDSKNKLFTKAKTDILNGLEKPLNVADKAESRIEGISQLTDSVNKKQADLDEILKSSARMDIASNENRIYFQGLSQNPAFQNVSSDENKNVDSTTGPHDSRQIDAVDEANHENKIDASRKEDGIETDEAETSALATTTTTTTTTTKNDPTVHSVDKIPINPNLANTDKPLGRSGSKRRKRSRTARRHSSTSSKEIIGQCTISCPSSWSMFTSNRLRPSLTLMESLSLSSDMLQSYVDSLQKGENPEACLNNGEQAFGGLVSLVEKIVCENNPSGEKHQKPFDLKKCELLKEVLEDALNKFNANEIAEGTNGKMPSKSEIQIVVSNTKKCS